MSSQGMIIQNLACSKEVGLEPNNNGEKVLEVFKPRNAARVRV